MTTTLEQQGWDALREMLGFGDEPTGDHGAKTARVCSTSPTFTDEVMRPVMKSKSTRQTTRQMERRDNRSRKS